MPASQARTNGHANFGRYQLRPSKAMMKVSRYRVRGASQRSGIEATFCVRWFVVARRSTEPVAESASHSPISRLPTGAAAGASVTASERGRSEEHTSELQ